MYFLSLRSKKAKERGDIFIDDEETRKSLEKISTIEKLPSPAVAVLPIILILVVLNVLKQDVILAMLCGIVLCSILFFKNLGDILEIFNYSAKNSAIAIINTAVVVGFGAVVKNSVGFQQLFDFSTNLKGSPLVTFGIMTTILAGACGSGSGGLGIALEAMSSRYLALGLNPEILHRVGSAASVGLDSLPHNGAVITLLTISGTTHKEAYKYIFFPTVVCTLVGMVVSIILGTILYPI